VRLGEVGIELEVEVLQGAKLLEAGASNPLLDLVAVAAIDLVLEQAQEELGVGQAILGCLMLSKVERFEKAAETQLLEEGQEVVKQSHGSPPDR
jgi:hypothetical protein